MTLVLHAIAREPSAAVPPGLRGTELRWIAAGDLGLWASPLDPAGAALDREDALRHHAIVEALCARGACLPVRFATRAADAAAAAALLSGREAQLRSTLERLAGRLEVAVTLLWRDAATVEGPVHRVGAARPGTAYLEAARARYAADDERQEVARRLARRLEEDLAVEQGDVWHAMCPRPEVALSASILARPGEGERTKERAVGVTSGYAGVRAVVSGPWPPYTFAAPR